MRYYQDVVYFLEIALINRKGNNVSGKLITYNIFKSASEILFSSGTLTEIGSTGVYKDNIIFTEDIQYRVEYITPDKFDNIIETFLVDKLSINDIQVSLDVLETKLCKVLGLVQSNMRYSDHVYNIDGCLTSAKLKLYNNKADTDNNINPFCIFTITATYDVNANLIGYKVTEDV